MARAGRVGLSVTQNAIAFPAAGRFGRSGVVHPASPTVLSFPAAGGRHLVGSEGLAVVQAGVSEAAAGGRHLVGSEGLAVVQAGVSKAAAGGRHLVGSVVNNHVSIVQVATGSSGTGPPGTTTSVAATWGTATTAGNFLIAFTESQNAATPSNAAWTALAAAVGRCRMWICVNAASQSGAQTWTFTGGNGNLLAMMEVAGIQTSSPGDGTGSSSSAGTHGPQSGSVVTANAHDLVVAGLFEESDAATDTLSLPTNGFTLATQKQINGISGTTFFSIGLLWKVFSVTGTYSTQVTAADHTNALLDVGIIGGFKVA